MFQISAELLEMSGEAALIINDGRVAFANSTAKKMLGADCTGKTLSCLFGEELAGIQAGSFIGEFIINGTCTLVRACSNDGVKSLFLTPVESNPELISDAFILSLRCCMMDMDINLRLLQQKDDLPEDTSNALALISYERYKINRIINNISFIRAFTDNSLAFNPIDLELDAHIRDTIYSLRSILPGVDIRFTSPEPIMIYASPQLIDLLLLNLLSNAIRHGAADRISVALHLYKDKVILSVDDNGCGIPGNELYSVFDRYRHSYGLNDMSRGAGLGLTVARLVTELHGGNLLLESREGQGTAVRAALSLTPNFDAIFKCQDKVYDKGMDILLTGLADCLPPEAFSAKFSD